MTYQVYKETAYKLYTVGKYDIPGVQGNGVQVVHSR